MRYVVLVLGLVMLAGCIDITVEQTLYRDGSIDLAMLYESDVEQMQTSLQREAQSGSIQETFEAGFRSEGLVPPAIELTQTDRGAKMVLKDFDASSAPAGLRDTTYTSFGWDREFSFPYYYYTYTIENPHAQSLTGDSFQSLTADVLDLYFVVKPFGKITETNGERLDAKTVRFDLLEEGTYTVTFRDLFLVSWMGGAQSIPKREAIALSKTPFGLSEEDNAVLRT